MTHFWIRFAAAALLTVGLSAGQAVPASAGVAVVVARSAPAFSDAGTGLVQVAAKKKPAEEKPCKGKNCKAAATKKPAAEKPCKGKNCKAAAKAPAEKPCKGKKCKAAPAPEKPCKGKKCKAAAKAPAPEKPCKGKHCKAVAEAPVKASPAKATPGVIAGGAVVSAEGAPVTYKVKSGDTLEGVARKLDTTQKQLIADNDLKKPYRLKLGQVLKGPASHGKAYVVQAGDTLYAIARRFSVDADELADYNGIKVSAALKPGKKLKLPPGYKDKGLPKPVAAPPTRPPPSRLPPAQPAYPPYVPPVQQPPVQQPPVQTQPDRGPIPLTREPLDVPHSNTQVPGNPTTQPRPYTPPTQPPARPYTPPPANNGNLPQAGPTLDNATIAGLGRGRFAWPVRGQIISGYGPKPGGLRNDGLDVAAPAGTPVFAAADGEVVYAGDQVPGFGNVVLIKHPNGWVTVYAHLARFDVKMRQQVTQGTQIGQVGNSGIAGEPQLHFEIRYTPSPREKARAIDPSLVLPQ